MSFHVTWRVSGPRPDVRAVIAFLFPEGDDVDSDGDAAYPASRAWTELELRSRRTPAAHVVVSVDAAEPLTLRVSSPSKRMALGLGYYLVQHSGGELRDAAGAPIEMAGVLEALRRDFDLDSRLALAATSP